ncbi:MAG TPA: ribonuclease HII [Candidatus Saccharimonadales bacterium]|nr:ribonuclease HII [Candidatus Saccharimonadales bacterium]
MIIGVDEVGRGCLAGPVCVAAVALSSPITGLDDSKKIPAPKRKKLSIEIKQLAEYVGIGWAQPKEVDRHGIVGALRLAAERALAGVNDRATRILLDGNSNYLHDTRVTTIIGGDGLEDCISAASIVAKVARDSYMQAVDALFPQYGFASHVGYGTKAHRLAITTHGPCALHRMSFAPLKTLSYVLN